MASAANSTVYTAATTPACSVPISLPVVIPGATSYVARPNALMLHMGR
jgi:hypothetical protein